MYLLCDMVCMEDLVGSIFRRLISWPFVGHKGGRLHSYSNSIQLLEITGYRSGRNCDACGWLIWTSKRKDEPFPVV
jgi:hypothetical protein